MKSMVLTLVLILSTSAFASDWRHARLQSLDGTAISLDFLTTMSSSNSNKPSSSIYASPLYVNVMNSQLTARDRVRAVLLNFCQSKGSGGDSGVSQMQFTIDLAFAQNGRFTGQLLREGTYEMPANALKIEGQYFYGHTYCWQELAVVINGQWLMDPYSKTHNFSLSLANAR